jgi:hypothetical protein
MSSFRTPAIPPLSFFADSSSKDKAFMVAGGFAVSGSRITEIEDRISKLRASAGIRSEFHWSAYRGGNRRQAYEDLVDYGYQLIAEKKLNFT